MRRSLVYKFKENDILKFLFDLRWRIQIELTRFKNERKMLNNHNLLI